MRIDVAFTPAEAGPAHVAVVVDVMRATSTIAQALASGYRRVLCCREIDDARALRRQLGDEAVVGGERDAVQIEGFDLGASPREYLEPRAETAILTTTNGTRSTLAAAANAEHVLLGSLLNLDAVAAAAREPGEDITVVCAGYQGAFRSERGRLSPQRQTRSTSCSAACSTWTLLRLRRVSQARTSRSSAPAIRARSRSTTPIAPAESSPSWKASRPTQRSPRPRSHGHIRPRGVV